MPPLLPVEKEVFHDLRQNQVFPNRALKPFPFPEGHSCLRIDVSSYLRLSQPSERYERHASVSHFPSLFEHFLALLYSTNFQFRFLTTPCLADQEHDGRGAAGEGERRDGSVGLPGLQGQYSQTSIFVHLTSFVGCATMGLWSAMIPSSFTLMACEPTEVIRIKTMQVIQMNITAV